MSRRYTKRTMKDDEFETEIFKNIDEKSANGSSESDESGESEASDDERLLESDEDNEANNKVEQTNSKDDSEGDEDDDDDDDAPETVSFKSGKESAIQRMKQVMQQIDAEKNALKMKRRKTDEQFKEQKRKKLEDLNKNKLPDDFFDDLPDEIQTPKYKSKKPTGSTGSLEEEEEGSLADTEEDFDVSPSTDYLPFDDSSNRLSGVQVSTLQNHQQKTKSATCRASEFKNRHMYGSKIPRETSKAKFAKTEKKKAMMSR